MKKLITVFMILFYPFFSCTAQENQGFLIGNEKITLRYSTRGDVEKLLGKPEEIEYFERGGEDFFWNNFTVCSYDKSKLSFHYDRNGAIIRITVNTGYLGEVRFLERNIKLLTREDIGNFVKSIENRNDYRSVFISANYVGYDNILPQDSVITYGLWFDKTGKTTWVDMYYESPWE